MRLNKEKAVNICDRIILFSIYAVAFFVPISKALIETFVYMAIFFFVLKKIMKRDSFLKINSLYIAVFIYSCIGFFSIFTSTNPSLSSHAFLAKILRNIIFFLVTAEALNTKSRVKNMLYVLFISSAVVGIDGIFQFFTRKDFLRGRPVFFLDRIWASFGTPNAFGCYLATLLPFAMAYPFIKVQSKKLRFLSALLTILLFVCLILTISRGSWFAFISSVIFMSLWLPYLGVIVLGLGALIAFALSYNGMFLRERLSNFFFFTDLSSLDRHMMWGAALNMIKAHPLVGLGLGTFMFNFKNYVEDKSHYIAYAHNCYLQIAAEIGIIGLIAFLSILGAYFYTGIKVLNKSPRTLNWYILLASLASILGYCVQMVVDTTFYSLDLGTLFWLILGVGCSVARNIQEESRPAA